MAQQVTRAGTPHTAVHRLSRRFLEPAQDVLVLALGLVLFGLMIRTLFILVLDLLAPALDFRAVIAGVLFILVMVEVLRLLIVYLEEHRIAVDFMVELGIVSTLREIVLHGVVDLAWPQVLALSIFILTLGAVLQFGDLRPADDDQFPNRPDGERDALSTTALPVRGGSGR